MDLVEARKKAKELQEKKQEASPSISAPASESKSVQIETPPPKRKAEEARKAKIEKRKVEREKPKEQKEKPKEKESKSPEPKAKSQKPKAEEFVPEEGVKSTQELKTSLPKEEAFADLSFGEDLPELKGKEEALVLEEKPWEPEKKEKLTEKKSEGVLEVKVPKPEEEKKPEPEIVLEKEPEKDFYEVVVEDLVQYGYGELEAEKDLIELLSFRLGTEIYAISLVKIQQIIKPRPITLVHGAPSYILGIISLRGMIIPIFDLRRRLGLPASQPTRQSRIIIVKVKENVLAGLYVDQVLEVARVSQNSLEAPHAIFSGVEGEFLEGVARYKNQMLIILNLEQVILGEKNEGKAGEG